VGTKKLLLITFFSVSLKHVLMKLVKNVKQKDRHRLSETGVSIFTSVVIQNSRVQPIDYNQMAQHSGGSSVPRNFFFLGVRGGQQI
jgi:hypothetical protein